MADRKMTAEELKSFLPVYFNENNGKPFPLTITGGSMAPFLIAGRDKAFLTPFDGSAAVGDVLLFSYGDRLILHRVTKISDNKTLSFTGDAHTVGENNIPVSDILARCDTVIRDGGIIKKNDPLWHFFALLAKHPKGRKLIFKIADLRKKN